MAGGLNLLGEFMGKLNAAIGGWRSAVQGSAFGRMLWPAAAKGLEIAKTFAGQKANQVEDSLLNSGLQNVGAELGLLARAQLAGSVRDQVRAVAASYGWNEGANWLDLQKLISKESGWNPNAANPTSSARGLFQKMTSIHGPVEGTPAGQASWGLRYIRNTYGSPSAAWSFHKRHNYYRGGGALEFDGGGWLPGVGVNNLRDPEPVFNPQQWSILKGNLREGMTTRQGEQNIYVKVTIPADDIAQMNNVVDFFQSLDLQSRLGTREKVQI